MSKALIFIAFAGIFVSACKKEVAFEVPQVEDFTGKYFITGAVETSPGTSLPKPFSMATGVDSTAGFIFELVSNYYSYQGYRLTASILRNQGAGRSFMPIFYAGIENPDDLIPNQWTIAELDSVFKVGKNLPFGKGFGQVEMEFIDLISTPVLRLYDTDTADNTGRFVTIEQVEDISKIFEDSTQKSSWAKIVTFSFSCQMKISGEPTSNPIELKDCRATMLFKPYVK